MNPSNFFIKKQFYEYDKEKIHQYGAGILPYQVDKNKKVYILLGQDTMGNWSDFGGKCELKDKNNIKETACREFYEETLNSVIDLDSTRQLLRSEKNYKLVESKTPSGLPYYMFLLRIPMVPDETRDRFKRTYEYCMYLENVPEKIDIRWVSLETIMQCLNSDKNDFGWSLRRIFKKTLQYNKKYLVELSKI